MEVDIEDRDARAAVDPRLRRDGGVVQVAVAGERVGRGVMTGRARECVGARDAARRHGVPRGQRDVGGRDRGAPRSREEGVVVVRVPAQLPDDVRRHVGGLAVNRAAYARGF